MPLSPTIFLQICYSQGRVGELRVLFRSTDIAKKVIEVSLLCAVVVSSSSKKISFLVATKKTTFTAFYLKRMSQHWRGA